MESPGYSYQWCGGDTEYCIFPNDIIEAGCLWTFDGDAYFASSVAEPVSCCIGGYHTNYHTEPGGYKHIMGTKEGGNLIILGGCGPMGLGAISYGLTFENKPKRIVVTEVNDDRIARAREVISEEEAKEHGVELIYVNTAKMEDQVKELMDLTDGKGYDDVFVYIPNKAVCEIGNQIMAYDGCMNLFAGPTDPKFSADVNLYDCHYSRSKIIGSTGGNDRRHERGDRQKQRGPHQLGGYDHACGWLGFGRGDDEGFAKRAGWQKACVHAYRHADDGDRGLWQAGRDRSVL